MEYLGVCKISFLLVRYMGNVFNNDMEVNDFLYVLNLIIFLWFRFICWKVGLIV